MRWNPYFYALHKLQTRFPITVYSEVYITEQQTVLIHHCDVHKRGHFFTEPYNKFCVIHSMFRHQV
jgi:hypothetical protein